MTKIKEITDYLDSIISFKNSMSFDNCGLLIGNENEEVKKIGFALDLTKEVLKTAVDNNVNLVITHHPVIFYPQKSFLAENIAYECCKKSVSVISCHTCFDAFNGGVSDILANTLGLINISTVETQDVPSCLRIGNIEEINQDDFANNVSNILNTTVRFVKGNRKIKKVAVCGGAGGDYIQDAINNGADAYVTGDLSHHHLLLAQNQGLTLIGAGHYETENISMTKLIEIVKDKFDFLECIDLKMNNPIKYISPKR